ncbi:FkbM family methyltransferase [candidate division WWE3 bacterium]|uniref:FkbM family methyltransferase n=1 Tax=candidate division WWE3 bacterium TaxID=2053526 RepID=A0A7X9DJK3_UNCKA|nr:FkbM family methyltransferase [candidate division WWE3 bacterium]
MKIIDKLAWLFRRNLIIDYKFITRVNFLKPSDKWDILFGKYNTLFKHFFIPFKTAESFINVNGEKIYYGTPYGLVGYSCMLAEQIYWLTKLNINNKPVILDVGANMGYFTLGCKKIFPNASIFCFEPVDSAYNALVKNVEKINDVTTYKFAVGEDNRKIGMDVNFKETSFSKISDKNPSYQAEMRKLDDIEELKNLPQIDIFKLDVEGYELNALKGAANLLSRTHYLLMELNSEEYSISDVTNLLNASGKKVVIKFIRNFELEQDEEFKSGDVLFELI